MRDGTDSWLQLCHYTGGKSLCDKVAQLAMAWRIHANNAIANRIHPALATFKLRHALIIGRESRVLAQYTHDFGIAKDLPATPRGVLEDRSCGSHRAIPLVRSIELLFIAWCLHLHYLSCYAVMTVLPSVSTIHKMKSCRCFSRRWLGRQRSRNRGRHLVDWERSRRA